MMALIGPETLRSEVCLKVPGRLDPAQPSSRYGTTASPTAPIEWHIPPSAVLQNHTIRVLEKRLAYNNASWNCSTASD
ncbi:MAG: hypothetical protein H6672_18615 [Anaerolineaceae bacterium]|nr:hypothetical protein [Anaerolineaceae bacterium]